MTVNKEQSRQMTAPDEFQKQAAGVYHWIFVHQQKLYVATAALVLVMAVGLTWNYFSTQRNLESLDKISLFDSELEAERDRLDKQKQSISNEIEKMSKKVKASEQLKNEDKQKLSGAEITDLKAKIASETSRLDSLKLNSQAIRDKYVKFFEGYPKTDAGKRAAVQALMLDIDQKNYGQAVLLAEQVLVAKKVTPFYDVQIRSIYVGLLEQVEKTQQALEQARYLREFAGESFLPRALLVSAGVEIRHGDFKKGIEDLQRIEVEFPDSPEAVKAVAYKNIALLEGEKS